MRKRWGSVTLPLLMVDGVGLQMCLSLAQLPPPHPLSLPTQSTELRFPDIGRDLATQSPAAWPGWNSGRETVFQLTRARTGLGFGSTLSPTVPHPHPQAR